MHIHRIALAAAAAAAVLAVVRAWLAADPSAPAAPAARAVAVDVGAGTQSAAWRGAAPLAPRPVSAAVLLRVAHALAELRRDACARLQVDVASEVEVNGDRVPVGRDGRVLVRVPGQRRRNPVEVVVRHVTGAVERRRVRCVEEAAEVKALEVRWDAR
jgi:hypothetical protein